MTASSRANYITTGSSPNRVFTFEWQNWEWQYNSTTPVVSFQVKLYEGTNLVQFVYRPESGAVASGSASVGLSGAASGQFLSLNSLGAAPTTSSTTETTNISAKPAAGQIYTFTPPACPPPSSLAAANVTSTTANLTFTAGSGNTSYTVTYTPAGGSATTVTPAPTASPVALTGLTPSTNYTVSVTANCSASSSTATPVTTSFTTLAPPPANDECGTAVVLTSAATCTATSGTVVGATQSNAPILCNGFTGTAPAQDVWYQFTATGTTHTITVTGTFDGVLEVLSGACGATANVGCSDVGGNNETLTLTSLTNGAVYRLRYYPYTPNPTNKTFTICVTNPPATSPTITSFTPTSGPAGTSVVITGTNFTGTTAVAFNGTAAPGFVVNSATQITVNVPAGAFSGPITVTTPVGTATSSTSFDTGNILIGTNLTACSGTIYDSGGPSGSYQNNENRTTVLTPGTAGSNIQLVFSAFSTEADFDFLRIYDGPTSAATLIGAYSGTTSPGTITATNATGQLTLVFTSDFSGIGTGFAAAISCVAPPACPPPSSLAATNVTSTTANVTFTAGSGNTSYAVTYTPTGGAATTVTPAPTASPVALSGLTPSTTYTVSIIGNCAGGTTSTAATTTFTTPALPPANDECSTATAIANIGVNTCGTAVNGTNVGATASSTTGTPNPGCAGYAGGDVWFSLTVPANGIVQVQTDQGNGTSISDTGLALYSGTCGNLTLISCDDDSGPGAFSLIRATGLVAGSTIYARVWEYSNDNFGTFTICAQTDPACPPVTALSATNITGTTANVTFTASAASYTVTYTPTGGAATTVTPAPTASPVALSGLTPSTAYTVSVVANCTGGTTSTAATTTFTTLAPPPINDECSTAIALTAGTPGAACSATSGTTTGATASAGVTNSCSAVSTPDDDVWYSFVAAGTTQTITVVGATGFDAVVNLRAGSCPGTDVQCVDNTGGGGTETITATGLTMGATYFVRVYHYNTGSGTGNFTICVTTPALCAAPTAVAVGTITPTTASVSFTAGNGNTGYTVTYTPSGGAALTATGAASPIVLSGLTPGAQYAVTVTGNCSGGQTATSTPAVTFTTASPPPANDLCSGATPIACGQTLTGTTVDATSTGDPTAACGSTTPSASPSVFYSFTGTGDIVTVTTCGTTSIDTELFVYSGTCGALTCVGGNDDFSACAANGQASSVTFTSVVGTTYYFMVQRFSFTTATGAFSLNVSCTPAPADLTVASGQNLTASGTYNNITVQTGGTLTLTGNTTANGNTLVQTGGVLITNCQVLDGAGTFTLSAGAELRICAAQGIRATASTGAIQSSGTRTFSTDAIYVYNGTVAQVSGNGLPLQVRTLAVDNPAGLTLSRNLSVAQVTRLTNGNLTTVGNTFTLLSSAAGTALVDNTGGSVIGTGTMQRAITNAVTGPAYRHFSSPVQSTTLADLTTTGFAPTFNASYNNSATPSLVTPFPTVFGYDESRLATVTSTYGAFDKGWFSPAGSGDVMQPNRGYTANAPATATPIDFVGTFNNAAQNSGTLSRGTDAAAGWQLLGNPYPAPLDWSTVGAGQRPGMDGAMYVYQSTGQYAGTYRSYDNGVGASPLIDAGSGYFARVTTPGTSGAVNLANANRVTVFGAQPAFGRGTTDTRPQLHLQLAGAGLADDTYLYLEQGATASVDAQYDATKLANPAGLDLASLSGTTPLAINGLAPLTTTDVVVPLTLRVPQAGSFNFEVGDLANFGAATVYLRDALTGTQLQLATGTRYQFALATATAGTGRFSVVFRAATVTATKAELNAASVSLYPNPSHGSFTVLLPPLAGQREVRATLVNALGQVVLTRTIGLTAAGATAEFNTRPLATGVYTLKLQAENQALTKRVVVE